MAESNGANELLKLQWRPRANLDRKSIAIYLGVECGNPKAALKAIKSIDEAIERILRFPQIGKRFRHEHLASEYRMAQASPYIIFYRIVDSSIIIYRILHQRQNIDDYEFVDLKAE